jgi:branched-chain amino acid transport system substrate-binding protein
MNKTGKIIVWVVVIILVIWGISLLSKKNDLSSGEPIKIGFLGPLTGDLGNIGQNAQAAVSIAVDEINNKGGVLGKRLEVVYEDDGCNGATGANAISKLINTDKVVAVLGGLCSGATLGEAPIAEAAKIPQLAYASTNPTISQAGDYIFRDVPSDNFQAKFVAQYLMKIGKKNVALLTAKDDYGDGLNKAFTEAFVGNGSTIVMNDSFDPSAKDFRTQLTKIKAKNPDAVYFVGYTTTTIPALKQAHDLGIKTLFFGADGWDDTKIWNELGTLGDGAMYTIIGTNSSDAFKAAMKAKLGKDDLIYASNYAYDGLKIIANAINKAGSANGIAIKDAMYKTNYTNGVSAKEIKFDSNGDPTSAMYTIKIVKDGKAEVFQ